MTVALLVQLTMIRVIINHYLLLVTAPANAKVEWLGPPNRRGLPPAPLVLPSLRLTL